MKTTAGGALCAIPEQTPPQTTGLGGIHLAAAPGRCSGPHTTRSVMPQLCRSGANVPANDKMGRNMVSSSSGSMFWPTQYSVSYATVVPFQSKSPHKQQDGEEHIQEQLWVNVLCQTKLGQFCHSCATQWQMSPQTIGLGGHVEQQLRAHVLAHTELSQFCHSFATRWQMSTQTTGLGGTHSAAALGQCSVPHNSRFASVVPLLCHSCAT